MHRDFWDWVVVVGVPVGVLVGLLTVAVGYATWRRGKTQIVFRDAQCAPVPFLGTPDPNQVRAGVIVTVNATGLWKRKKLKPTFRSGLWRRKVAGLVRDESAVEGGQYFPPSWQSGPWEGRVRWSFDRPDAKKLRMKLKVRLWPHGTGTFRGTLDIPPRFGEQ